MQSPPPASRDRVAFARTALYFAFWIVIDQSAQPANLAVGALSALGAAWCSLRLLPPVHGRVRLGVLVTLLPRFLWQSLRAGIDVARLAFSPRMTLATGFVRFPAGLSRGSARNAFELIASLMPGSVPTDEDDASIEFHCLDVHRPVVEQLAAEERAYAKALVPGRLHD